MPSLADAVRLAAETLREHPERWTHHHYFRTADGAIPYVDAGPEVACKACAIGMVFVASRVLDLGLKLNHIENELDDATARLQEADLADYNDHYAEGPGDVAARLDEIAAVL